MVPEKCILLAQMIASLFMGLDYFLNEKQRVRLNDFLKSHLHPLLNSEMLYLTSKLEKAKNNWLGIVLIPMFLGLSLLTAHYIFPVMEGWLSLRFALIVIFLTFLTLLISALKILDATFEEIGPIAFSFFKAAIARFLVNCPKGTGFGVGFLFLVLSFICRGFNVTW
ncbi:MAG: hypothetical protein ACOH2T_25740 [Pseudomonas sp.]